MTPIKQYYVDLGDGLKREIRFRLSTLIRLRKRTGKSFLQGDGFNGLDEEMIVALIHESLVSRDLTEEQIADMIPVNEIGRVLEEVLAVFVENMPEATTEKN